MNKSPSNHDNFVNGDDSGIATSEDNQNEMIKTNLPSPNKIKEPFRYSASSSHTSTTITLHYYPEGGWGWIVVIVSIIINCLTQGFHLSGGLFMEVVKDYFKEESIIDTGWLISTSIGCSLIVSPITVALCIKKSTRLTTVVGGLVTALGCLFTSFATQFHQLFFSYGLLFGIGVSMIRDSSLLMIGQYFKKRRKFVEIFITSSPGLGLSIMSYFIKYSVRLFKFRLGLHLVSAILFSIFFLGMFYRSASLYHPQRRAILHLKYQKKKIKEKNRRKERLIRCMDYKIMENRTFQIISISNCFSSLGLYNPIFFIAYKSKIEGIDENERILLHIYLGIAWIVGCITFSIIIINRDLKFKQYFCQISLLMCVLCIITLYFINGNFLFYVIFVWIFGFFIGGYNYTIKLLIYDKIKSKNFAKAWSFLQFFQSFMIFLGIPLVGLLTVINSYWIGYVIASISITMGCLLLYLLSSRKYIKNRRSHCYSSSSSCNCQHFHKSQDALDKKHTIDKNLEVHLKKLTFNNVAATNDFFDHKTMDGGDPAVLNIKAELTCISEEGIADIDLSGVKLSDDIEFDVDELRTCDV